jgi:hypothetical protein
MTKLHYYKDRVSLIILTTATITVLYRSGNNSENDTHKKTVKMKVTVTRMGNGSDNLSNSGSEKYNDHTIDRDIISKIIA